MKQTVVMDFDGVIHSYTSGWQGPTWIPDPPVEGIKGAIHDIREAGYVVAVVSSRCQYPGGIEAISNYLLGNDIVVDKVTADKVAAICYIDDRAICFDGDSKTLLSKINSLVPWNKKPHVQVEPMVKVQDILVDIEILTNSEDFAIRPHSAMGDYKRKLRGMLNGNA